MTNEEWQELVEEFGNDAYKQFLDENNQPFNSNDELVDYYNAGFDFKLKPLPELIKHGIQLKYPPKAK